ncbi:MAG: ComF family protein [Spirochaetales bacterium]|nr:ComF family protein [Spirochaetales bacterium]
MSISTVIKKYWFYALDVVLPCRCLVCGQSLLPPRKNEYNMCRCCQEKIVILKGKRCIKCSMPLISEVEICTRCREREFHFEENYSICEYRGIIKELIYFYKFKAKRTLAVLFAKLLYNYLSLKKQNLLVIPIPSTRSNIRKRGWDHIKEIAFVLHNRYRVPVLYCLKREGKLTQKGLNSKDRFTNILGKVTCTHPQKLAGIREVVLLDDIFTTGATASECARVLLGNGIKKVSVLTIALD